MRPTCNSVATLHESGFGVSFPSMSEHGHRHDTVEYEGRAFLGGMALNLAFVAVEVVYGLRARSLALLSDAGHNLGDVLALGLSLVAVVLARSRPSRRRTYGLRKATVLATLANAIILVAATGAILWESILRVLHPVTPAGMTMMAIAAAGVFVNGGSALLFLRGRRRDLNVRSAFVHLAGDAAIALGVVVAGGVIALTGWARIDPAVSLIVSVLVLLSSWRLLKSGLGLVVDAVPEAIDVDAVRALLSAGDGVVEVHDLHVWAMSTTETALTAHVVVRERPADNALLQELVKGLERAFEISHATIQIELQSAAACHLAAEDRV